MEAEYQERVKKWLLACFGKINPQNRGYRFIEEALELVQATGCSKEDVLKTVDYVYNRPVGEPFQEIGGIMITLAGLCEAVGLNMTDCGEKELVRVWEKIKTIREKDSNKPLHSPLPQ